MSNQITVHGRLTADPELKTTQSNVSVCSFNVACDRRYAKQGEDRIADFFTVVAWRGMADMVCKYFSKGKEILIFGEMQSRRWQDKDGNNRVSWEVLADRIEFCGKKDSVSNAAAIQADDLQPAVDDDLPF